MKYKVIGWTYYDNYSIPFSDNRIGFAERNAIIDDIKKHKYLFSGWDHQESWDNCVPVLNDGKKRGFSQRGWGGVMAEAYGKMGDYDYSIYSFYGSVKNISKKSCSIDFSPKDFVSEPLLNEHFDVTISEELFEIAKKKNPFYLDDLAELRFIDTNDTITLHCNGETLNFLVDDIDRNIKELDFVNHDLINGKYKIIVKHKPMRKVINRLPLLISYKEANNLFKQVVKKYDFNTLYELFSTHDIEVITKKSKAEKTYAILKRFVLEYTDYDFDVSCITRLLNYINDFEFYKEVAFKVIDFEIKIFINFLNKYFNEGINIDEFLPLLIKKYKGKDYYILDLLLRAVEINPNNKGLRKRYYKTSKFYDFNGFLICIGVNDFNSILKKDKKMIELEDFSKCDYTTIRHITELMTYPNNTIKYKKDYPYNVPSIYSKQYECIKNGVLNFQKYVNEHFDLSNRLEELLLIGIKKKGQEMKKYFHEEEKTASYVLALEMLTNYKYSLVKKAIVMFPILKEYIKTK